MKKAEEADSTPLDAGLSLPEEIKRREDRKAALAEARKLIEERYKDVREQKQKDYEEKKKAREEQRTSGKKPRGESLSRRQRIRPTRCSSTLPTMKAGS